MRKVLVLIAAATAILVILGSCSLSPTTAKEATVPVYLTDKPVNDVDKILVDIGNVTFKYETPEDEREVSVSIDVENLDLLSLAGTEMSFFDMEIPEDATLVYIKLEVKDATVVMAGQEHGVNVVNGSVKIMVNEKVSEGDDILLDFDAMQSLKLRGDGTYIMIPTIGHVHRHRNEGFYKVYGKVTDTNGEPLKGAVVALLPTDESTILKATVTDKDGEYTLRAVKAGEYILNFYVLQNPIGENENLLNITPDESKKNISVSEDTKVDAIISLTE